MHSNTLHSRLRHAQTPAGNKMKKSRLFVALLLGFCGIGAIASPAQTFKTLVNFDGSNGSLPLSSLTQGVDGFLYGTTEGGTPNNAGTVFRINGQEKLDTLYTFCGECSDGGYPVAGLVQVSGRDFYGTTSLLSIA